MKDFSACLEAVRRTAPLVHNITNYVTATDVANAILALGASPIMADEPEEAAEICALCASLNINIGTLNSRSIESMFVAGRKANELGLPTLLDPVGVGASQLRLRTALRLMRELKLTLIRGNSSELKTLALGSGTTRGVDAEAADQITEEALPQAVRFVRAFAARSGSIIVMTGSIDVVSDAEHTYLIRNGRPEMRRITGTGCQLSGLISAFLAANPEAPLEASAAAVALMGLAGEIGWSQMRAEDGNSTYRNRIIDAIERLDGPALQHNARWELR